MNAVIFGSSGGIGSALTNTLIGGGDYRTVFSVSRRSTIIDGATNVTFNPEDERSLTKLSEQLAGAGPLSLCIVATGTLTDGGSFNPERSYKHQTQSNFERIFAANTIVPAMIAKHVLPIMPRNERGIFAALSARVGSISDNRLGGWHAYRASKAALNMLVKNYAIEQARRNPNFIAVSLHPGTVKTALSKPFQNNVPDGQLFSPKQSADYLLNVLNELNPEDTGKSFDWNGQEIPF